MDVKQTVEIRSADVAEDERRRRIADVAEILIQPAASPDQEAQRASQPRRDDEVTT